MDQTHLSRLVEHCVDGGNYESGATLAEELCEVEPSADNYLIFANCLFQAGQYRRLVSVLQEQERYVRDSAKLLLLFARSYLKIEEMGECIDLLDAVLPEGEKEGKEEEGGGREGRDERGRGSEHEDDRREREEKMGMTASIAAAICVVRAKAHSLQMNIAKCVYWYTAALKRDALCTEALDVLCSHYLLSKAEQLKLVDSLDTKDYGEWLRMLYQVKLPAVLSPAARLATAKKLKVEYGMKQTHDLTYVEARACSDRFDLTRSLSLTTPVINKGVMHEDCIILHAITLYRLDKEPELYLLGHKLSEDYPNSQIGLFVVGCYYLLQAKKNDSRTKRALVYFEKSVSKSWYFLPGWMGYAFAYALKSSTDEVLRAYSRAERFAPGSHYLPLCTGMEYLATNQVALAFRYLKLAKSLCSTDPMVHHELGIAAYRMGEVEKAASHLTRVLDLLRQYDDRIVDERDYCHVDFLEPLYCNLGHVMRRRECYSEAVEYFKRAIALRPKHAANYSALGLTYAMMGSDALAIDVLHTALSLSPFEKYASELLDKLMNWMADVNVDEAVGMMTSSFSCI